MKYRKRIILVTKSLQIGGVERALIALANELSHHFIVTILIFDSTKKELIEELNKNIEIKYTSKALYYYMCADKENKRYLPWYLNIYKGFIRILEKIGVKRTFEKFIIKGYMVSVWDYAVSYAGYPGPWDSLVLNLQAKKRIAYIHNNPYSLNMHKLNIREYYEHFNEIICVSKDIKNKMLELDCEMEAKIKVLYNLVDRQRINTLSQEKSPFISNGTFKIVTVARIENNSKRFDRIVACVKKMISSGFINFEWHIIGDGEDKKLLNTWIKKDGLEKYVILEGFQLNPYKYIGNADLFVLASDYEGLPVTIMEALCLGIPSVVTGFSCAHEVIKSGINGLICEKNAKDLCENIVEILSNKELYDSIKNAISSQSDLDSNEMYTVYI